MRVPVVLLLLVLVGAGAARAGSDEAWSREQKVFATNATAATLIALWGYNTWDYGQYESHYTSEAWFEADTKHGGADKVGHFWVNFTLADVLANVYQSWGYSSDDAAFNATLSAVGLTAFMEWGDSFSYYGFSYQDFTMNVLGGISSWWLYTHPRWREKIDLRVEYIPTGDTGDVFTDYEGLKYLAAIRASGFDATRTTPWRYFEFHIGAYARGYETRGAVERQYAYVGIGVDLAHLFERHGMPKTSRVLRYLKVPGTDVKAVRRVSP